ncbi:MAG: winged helix DNA-binding domain-containing protein [Ardenticatenales bacterium]|nr:winged helix DNA-binding domain-containing protein [Ardenticatenales bacterium]
MNQSGPLAVTARQVRWFRFRRSGLARPLPSAEAVVAGLVGVQAQILPASALALWHRTPQLDHAAFDQMLHKTRTLVKLWSFRSTLHLHCSDEWPLIYAATWQKGMTYYERRMIKNGGNVAEFHEGIRRVTDLLRQRQTMTRTDLRAADIGLSDTMLSSWGGIFSELVHRGLACHAGQNGGEAVFAWREH